MFDIENRWRIEQKEHEFHSRAQVTLNVYSLTALRLFPLANDDGYVCFFLVKDLLSATFSTRMQLRSFGAIKAYTWHKYTHLLERVRSKCPYGSL